MFDTRFSGAFGRVDSFYSLVHLDGWTHFILWCIWTGGLILFSGVFGRVDSFYSLVHLGGLTGFIRKILAVGLFGRFFLGFFILPLSVTVAMLSMGDFLVVQITRL